MKTKSRYQTPIAIIESMINKGDLGEYIGKSYKDKKALGGVLTVASQLLPTLGNIGSLLKGTQQGHTVQENVNPYGYQHGGSHNPPIKRQQTQQSTTAVNTPLPVFGDEVRKLPMLTQDQITNEGLTPQQAYQINAKREQSNANIDKYGWEGKPLLSSEATKAVAPNTSNPVIENIFKYGGKKYGMGGFKQYNAPTHEQGGQMIDERGNPNPNGNSEIEGTENMYTYSNIPKKHSYIFSDKNGTSDIVKAIINKKRKMNPDLDEPTKNLMELEIQNVENLNESINGLRENVDRMFNTGGPLSPLPQSPSFLSTDLDNPTLPDVQFAPGFTYPSEQSSNLPSFDKVLRGAVMGVNALGLLNKPEQEDLISPDYGAADRRFGNLNANLDAARDEVLSGRNAASNTIRSGSQSFQSLLARELQNSANTNRALNNISLQEQQIRNNINSQVGQYEANKAQDIANREYQNRLDNLQNEAVNRNIKRGITSDLLAEADRLSTIKNNAQIASASVEETKAILNNMYPDFQINDMWIQKAKQLSTGEITEDEYNKFVQSQSVIKFRG